MYTQISKYKISKMGLSCNYLKVLACLFMLVDHIGLIILPHIVLLRIIGRLSFPIFAYMIANGFIHSSNKRNYLFRLIIFAIIFQIPYTYFTGLSTVNIFAELSIGLITLIVYSVMKQSGIPKIFLIFIPIFFGYAAEILHFDYGIYGILLIFFSYYFHDDNYKLSISWLLINLIPLFGINDIGSIQIFSLFALFFILQYNGQRGKGNKYLFYLFYGLHIPLLYFVKIFLGY